MRFRWKFQHKKLSVRKIQILQRRNFLTLTRSLRTKMRKRWFFDVFKVKKSTFFSYSDFIDPSQIFDAHLFENTNFSPSKLKSLEKFRFDKEMSKKCSILKIMVFKKLKKLGNFLRTLVCWWKWWLHESFKAVTSFWDFLN